MNEELGRHRGREGKVECSICVAECGSVVHVLWECPAYSSCREGFRAKFKELIGDSFEQLSDTESSCSSSHTRSKLNGFVWTSDLFATQQHT